MDDPVPPLGQVMPELPVVAVLAAPGSSARAVLDLVSPSDRVGLVELTASGAESGHLDSVSAVMVLMSAAAGIDGHTVTAWEEAAELALPRAVVISLPDDARVDFDEMVAIAQRVLDDDVVARYLPMLDDDGGFAGVFDLVTQHVIEWSRGTPTTRAPDPEHVALTAEARDELVEAILTHHVDDALMRRHIGGAEISPDALAHAFNECVADASLFPAVPLANETVRDLVTHGLIPGAELRART